MAETKLHNYSVQEKLNKMDIDLIDVTVEVDVGNVGAYTAGDVMFAVTEIPNAVPVNGGVALLQSCSAIINGAADGTTTGAFDVIITSDSTTLSAAVNAAASGNTDALAVMDGTCGFFSITNAFDAGVVSLGDKKNIGMVCKAIAGSRSLYIWGIAQNAGDYIEGSIVFRLGFVKD